MNPVLERRVFALDQERRIVGDHVAKRFDPGPFAFCKIAKDVTRHELLHVRLADADAHAPVVVAQVRRDRPQSVMPGVAAADFYPHFGRPQIDLIVKDGDVTRLQLVEVHGFRDRPA